MEEYTELEVQVYRESYSELKVAKEVRDSVGTGLAHLMVLTKLTQVKAEVGSFHRAGILTHGPNVVVHEDREAGERRHSEPHQEEEVGQNHELQTARQEDESQRQSYRPAETRGSIFTQQFSV